MVTGISYVDRDGNEQSSDGSEATFTVSASGSLSVFTKRVGQSADELGKGTLVAGATYLFYLTSDGDLYAWGDNRYGVLGLGTSTSVVRVPTYVMSGVAKVATTHANAYENGDTTFTTAILTQNQSGIRFTVQTIISMISKICEGDRFYNHELSGITM